MLRRYINKCYRELYRMCHPSLWGKRLQINGVPKITEMNKLNLGMDVSINEKTLIQTSGVVSIGDRVTISRGTSIFTTGLDTTNYTEMAKQRRRKDVIQNVEIGEGTWLCANVTVLPGVKIARNCIVAAGSIVSSNLLEDGCLYGGVPAKRIKQL